MGVPWIGVPWVWPGIGTQGFEDSDWVLPAVECSEHVLLLVLEIFLEVVPWVPECSEHVVY